MNDQELQALYGKILAARAAEGQGREGCVSPEQLQQLAEGTASEEQRTRWMDHVAACPMCMSDLAIARATADAGSALTPRRPQLVRLALAASIAVVAVGTLVWYRGLRVEPDVMRGSGNAVSLVQPVGDVPGGVPLVLTWRPVPQAVSYEVEVLESTGTPILVTTTTDTSMTLPPGTSVSPGVEYRWRVVAPLRDGTRLGSPAQAFRIIRP